MDTAQIKKKYPTQNRGSINRGRFTKFYEQKANFVRFWGMCDVTGRDHQIFIAADLFYAFLECFNNRSYKNMRDLLKNVSLDEQRFLLDGISPVGWVEMCESMQSIGINEPLFYSDLAIKKVFLKSKET
jgi:hypothetical protein